MSSIQFLTKYALANCTGITASNQSKLIRSGQSEDCFTLDNVILTQTNVLAGFDAESLSYGGFGLAKLFERKPFPRSTPRVSEKRQKFAVGLDSIAVRARPGSIVVEQVSLEAKVPALFRVRSSLAFCRDKTLEHVQPSASVILSSPQIGSSTNFI